MKFLIGLLAFGTIFAISNAIPAKRNLVYIEEPSGHNRGPKHMMLLQYMQPGTPFARSTQAVEALVAGDTVAAGSYLEDGNVEIEADESSNDDVLSVAEAFPEESEVRTDSALNDDDTNEDAKEAREINLEKAAPEVSDAEPAVGIEVDVEDAAPEEAAAAPEIPDVPVVVAEPVPPMKKIYVELEENYQKERAHHVEDDEEEIIHDDYPEAPRKPVRGPSKKPAGSNPIPLGTFFPVNFGGTSGGAIAIANSFSTGEGGSATSHAIAYGSPEVRPSVRRTRKH